MADILGFVLILLSVVANGATLEDKSKCSTEDVAFSRDNTGVFFDPYVVYQDMCNPTYYDKEGITTLLKQVRTKFSHLMITFTDHQDYYKSCPELVSIVAAELNKMDESSTKVSLSVRFSSDYGNLTESSSFHGIDSNLYEAERQLFIKRISSLVQILDKANSIYPGTVKEISYEILWNAYSNPYEGMRLFRQLFKNSTYPGYRFGQHFNIKSCEKHIQAYKSLPAQPIGLLFYSFSQSLSISSLQVEKTTADILQEFEICRSGWENTETKPTISFLASISDTSIEDKVQFNNSIHLWQAVNNWATDKNTSLYIFSAFDTLYQVEGEVGKNTSGWWTVVQNSSYQNPSQFIFEEKRCLQNPHDLLSPLLLNTSFLSKTLKFNKNIGIFFHNDNLYKNIQKNNATLCNETCLGKLFLKLFPNISLIFSQNSRSVARAVANNNFHKTIPTELVLIMNDSNPGLSLEITQESNSIYPETVKAVLFRMFVIQAHYRSPPSSYDFLKWRLRTTKKLIEKYNITDFDYGIIIEADFLLDISKLTKLVNTGLFTAVEKVYIISEVEVYDVGQEIGRLLLQLTAKLEVCVDVVRKAFKSINKTGQVGVITGWAEKAGVEELEEMISLIQFYEGINSWAERVDFRVIFSRALDNPSNFDWGRGGWWRITEKNESISKKFEYLDKKEIALEMANDRLAKLKKLNRSKIEGINIIISLLGLLTLALLIVAIIIFKRRTTRSKILEEFEMGSGKELICIGMEKIITEFDWEYDKLEYEVGKKDFKIDALLGSGLFGQVYNGSVIRSKESIEVAAKTAKSFFSEKQLSSFLSEIKVLSYVGKHENVVEFIGAYTSELRRKKGFIFLEMCELSSLKDYLKKMESADNLTTNLFYKWAYEIANGMEYLTTKRIIHLDLATRNVLLSSEKVAKISDFGLSRRLENYNMYLKKGHEPLPWGWMSIEALVNHEFSEKSDVWAFGVTLWEIFSLGQQPYEDLGDWSPIFLENLRKGHRLQMPKFISNDKNVFPIMESCWLEKPDERPSFFQLKNSLLAFL